ncbi:MAG TPA: YdbH domain-containing protein [Azospirillaceae bacterium]|nr:YdbH domain-containing protein [Azospirillaceae bacterium]
MDGRESGRGARIGAVAAGIAAMALLFATAGLPALVEERAESALRDAGWPDAAVQVRRLGVSSSELGIDLAPGQGISNAVATYSLGGLAEGRLDRLELTGLRLAAEVGPGGVSLKGRTQPQAPPAEGPVRVPVGEIVLRDGVLSADTPAGPMTLPLELTLRQPEEGRFLGQGTYRVEPGGLAGTVVLDARHDTGGTAVRLALDPAGAEGTPALTARVDAEVPAGAAHRITADLAASSFPLPDGAAVSGTLAYRGAEGGHEATGAFKTTHGVTADIKAALPGGGVGKAELSLAAADLAKLRPGLTGTLEITAKAAGKVAEGLPPVTFTTAGKGLTVPGLATRATLAMAGTATQGETGLRIEATKPWSLEGRGAAGLPEGIAGQPLFLALRPAGDGSMRLVQEQAEGGTVWRYEGALGLEAGPYVLGGGVPEARLRLAEGRPAEAALRLLNGQVTDGARGVAADGLSLVLDYLAGRERPLALTAAAGLRGTGAAPVLPALKAELTAGGDPLGVMTAKAALEGAGGALVLDANARHDMRDASGSVALKLHPITFLPGSRQPQDLLPALKGRIEEGSGTFGFRARVGWGPKGPKGSAEMLLDRITLVGPAGAVRGLSGVLTASSLTPLVMPPQTLSVGLLEAGIPLEGGIISFEVEKDETLRLDKAEFGWAGGSVRVLPFRTHIHERRRNFVLEAVGLDLGRVLSLATVDGLAGSGKLDGRIPMSLAGTDLRFENGRLGARAPGRIAYDPANPPAFMDPKSNSSVALAMQALQNFQYKDLAVTIDGAAGREMKVTLRVDGANPDFYGGYPVKLNVNLSGALGSIVQAGLGSYRIPDTVRERIEEYSQQGAPAP